MSVGTPARNPVVWGWDQLRGALHPHPAVIHPAPKLAIARLAPSDLGAALAEGWADFRADPTHYLFLCAFYPVVGLVLGRLASGAGTVALIFPLVAGFALLGPFAAVGLYELSRRREAGQPVAWWTAFGVFRAPYFPEILKLGLGLSAWFVLWLIVAEGLYLLTLGPVAPHSVAALLAAVFGTRAGWALLVLGNAAGFGFAAAALVAGVVSFPMIVDRGVSVETALAASLATARANPAMIAGWGLIVAAILVLGSLPFLLGLAVAIPLLGHATWHLYRRAVIWPEA